MCVPKGVPCPPPSLKNYGDWFFSDFSRWRWLWRLLVTSFFRAVGFFSCTSVELRVGNCPVKFQTPILFGGRTVGSQIWSKSRFRTFRSSRDKLRTIRTAFLLSLFMCRCQLSGPLPHAYQRGPYPPPRYVKNFGNWNFSDFRDLRRFWRSLATSFSQLWGCFSEIRYNCMRWMFLMNSSRVDFSGAAAANENSSKMRLVTFRSQGR